MATTKPRGGTGSPPTGLARLWRSSGLRVSQRASGFQRCYCTLYAPSGGSAFTTTLMARRCARWRIHRQPPSRLRPRREVAPPLPPRLNVRHCQTRVKSAPEFSSRPGIPLWEQLFQHPCAQPRCSVPMTYPTVVFAKYVSNSFRWPS